MALDSVAVGIVAASLAVSAYILLIILSPTQRKLSKKERKRLYHQSLRTLQNVDFPYPLQDTSMDSSKDKQARTRPYLSVVVPAYKESSRLPKMLTQTLSYLEKLRKAQKQLTYEIIVVDDGSNDGNATVNSALDTAFDQLPAEQLDCFSVLKFEQNRGKGGAVTQGILCSSGKYVLFADADGATEFKAVEELEEAITNAEKACGGDSDKGFVAIGSRAHLVDTEAVVKRSPIRNFLMYSFHTIVYLLCSRGVAHIKDTQCGFKMFNRAAIKQIFPFMHVEGWIFDIELLDICFQNGVKVTEIPVNWSEIEGSKMNLISASISMLVDLVVIRLNYFIGRWKTQ